MTPISYPLNPGQADACSMLLRAIEDKRHAAVLGIAGSGKTYSVAGLLHMLKGSGKTVEVVAPTKRAVGVLQQNLRNAGLDITVRTMHAAIYKPKWRQPLTSELASWLRKTRERMAQANMVDATSAPDWILDIIAVRWAEDDSIAPKQLNDFVRGADLELGDEDMVSVALKSARIEPLTVILDNANPDTTAGWVPRTEKLSDVIIVDEASMLMQGQAEDLRKLCDTLIIIGDPIQLPPVTKNKAEHGALDPEYMDSLGMEVRTLTENMRQSGTGGAQIADIAGRLRLRALVQRDVDIQMVKNTLYDEAEKPGSAISFCKDYPMIDLLRGAPLVVWTNHCRHSVNSRIRQAIDLAPDTLGEGEQVIINWLSKSRSEVTYDPDMRLTVNTLWRVAKLGDETTLVDAEGNEVRLYVRMDHPDVDTVERLRKYDAYAVPLLPKFGSYGAYIEPAWALTCHKMQGAEADHVLIAWHELVGLAESKRGKEVGSDGIPMWIKWFYTALTRARSHVTFVRTRDLGDATLRDIADALSNTDPDSTRPIL